MNTDRMYYSREAELQAQRDRTVMGALLMALGVGIGTVLALLFAPASGSKTRKDLAQTLETGVKDGREAVEPMVKRLEHDIADLRQRFQDRVSQ